MGKKGAERFQWSIQKSIKVRAIPFLLDRLQSYGDTVDIPSLENEFCSKFKILTTENTEWGQRPFARTLFFMQNDLGLLGEGNIVRPGLLSETGRPALLDAINRGAMDNLKPFQVMMEIFHTYNEEKFPWDRFKMDMSRKLVMKAKSENVDVFEEKDRKVHGGIYNWSMDDPSINRLVELGRLLGICSFVVMQHVRFVSDFKMGESIKTLDLETMVGLLKEEIPGLDHTKPFTVDEINIILKGRGYTEPVIADALESEAGMIVPFSGHDTEVAMITIRGKSIYRLRFDEKAFEVE